MSATGIATFSDHVDMSGQKTLRFSNTGTSGPGTSPGTKIRIFGDTSVEAATGDYSFGVNASMLWYNSGGVHAFYNTGTETMRIASGLTTVTGRGHFTAGLSVLNGAPLLLAGTDLNWGLYRSTSGAGLSLTGGTATSVSGAGVTSNAMRFRAGAGTAEGYIWENNLEQASMGLNSNTGVLWVKGRINGNAGIDSVGSITSTNGVFCNANSNHGPGISYWSNSMSYGTFFALTGNTDTVSGGTVLGASGVNGYAIHNRCHAGSGSSSDQRGWIWETATAAVASLTTNAGNLWLAGNVTPGEGVDVPLGRACTWASTSSSAVGDPGTANGTRLRLYGASLDTSNYAIGINSNTLWYNTTSVAGHSFRNANVEAMRIESANISTTAALSVTSPTSSTAGVTVVNGGQFTLSTYGGAYTNTFRRMIRMNYDSSASVRWDMHIVGTASTGNFLSVPTNESSGDLIFQYGSAVNSNGEMLVGGFIRSNAQFQSVNFTGSHHSASDDLRLWQGDQRGLIVRATGRHRALDDTLEDVDVNQAIPVVELCDSAKDKRCFGVVGAVESPESGTREYMVGAWGSFQAKCDDRVVVNSVGEGAIWVCDVGGTIENGDYVTTSAVLGYGMLQDDDLLHNYTIAKITIDCDFEPGKVMVMALERDADGNKVEDENGKYMWYETGGERDEYVTRYVDASGSVIVRERYDEIISEGGEAYRCAFVPCTYHGG
jgi:hypothetical protein